MLPCKPYKSITILSDAYDALCKKYEFNSLKVVVLKQNEIDKLLKLMQMHNKYLIEFDEICEEFYTNHILFPTMQSYIKAGFLDVDFIPTNPKLTEIP